MAKAASVGVPKETYQGEARVAAVPTVIPTLTKAGIDVLVESGAGLAAGFTDEEYGERGATVVEARKEVFGADVILRVRAAGADPEGTKADLELLRADQLLIGFLDPLGSPAEIVPLAEAKVIAFAIELLPRITRAQGMDALSSQANIGGYKAALLGADHLPKMFPMLTTAAGTIAPAKVFVIGAGVAGLQAIATARRLGAVVEGYDVRPAAKDEIASLGARVLQFELPDEEAQGEGGYAREQSEEFLKRQREAMTRAVAHADVVITTAAVPGKKAPTLVTADMVGQMTPGSLIVDLAAERGGNCELTKPGETFVTEGGVTILGPANLPATIPHHASQMYAKNLSAFLLNMRKEGEINLDTDDEIVRETLCTRDGEVVHERVRELLGGTTA